MLAVVAWCAILKRAAAPAAESHDYCILGAGPGGLQVGQLMLNRGWDYVMLERKPSAGSFFDRYPVHRQLISLNKRFTGRKDHEFNLRHDWNSLLENDDVLGVPNRTSDRFPKVR